MACEYANAGAHLGDYQGINYTWRMQVRAYNDILRHWWGKTFDGAHHLLTRGGPLAKSINHGGVFSEHGLTSRPNMQLYFQAFSNLLPKTGGRPLLTRDPYSGLSIGLSNFNPTSRGSIRIKSSDPRAHLEIRASAFSTEELAKMPGAVTFLRHIAAQPDFAKYVAEELRPRPAVQSDEDLIADFRAL